jgi:hypothetical protein
VRAVIFFVAALSSDSTSLRKSDRSDDVVDDSRTYEPSY